MTIALISTMALLTASVPATGEDFRALASSDSSVAFAIDIESVIVLDDLRLFTMVAAPKGVSPSPGFMIVHVEVDCAARTTSTLNMLGVRDDTEPVPLPMDEREPESLRRTATGRAVGAIVCDGSPANGQAFSSSRQFADWAAGLPPS